MSKNVTSPQTWPNHATVPWLHRDYYLFRFIRIHRIVQLSASAQYYNPNRSAYIHGSKKRGRSSTSFTVHFFPVISAPTIIRTDIQRTLSINRVLVPPYLSACTCPRGVSARIRSGGKKKIDDPSRSETESRRWRRRVYFCVLFTRSVITENENE